MTVCLPLERAGAHDARIGGKARSLLRLAAAGAAVPRAFAITTELFRALRAAGPPLPAALNDDQALATAREAAAALEAAPWPAGFGAALAAALAELDPAPTARFSVRSSATLEDRADAVGAGIFLSRTDVAARDVPAAVRAVLSAALAPAALAYAARRGLPTSDLEMAVLVHPFTRGDAAGTAAFDPTLDDAPLVDAARAISAAAHAAIVRVTRGLAARDGAIEVEWVATGDDVLFVQLRPYRAPARRPWSGAAQLADAPWRWDAAHNPLPLSPAHAGLVAFVDARCRTGLRQRVVKGYLFFAASAASAASTPAPDATAALRALSHDAEARLAALGDAPSLEDALDAFARIYEPLFGVVQPAARAARDALRSFLGTHARREPVAELLRGVPSLATERHRGADAIARAEDDGARAAAVAAYVARFGDEAPAWDVAAPTYAEDAGPLRRVGARPTAAPSDAGDAAAAFVAALPADAHDEGRLLLTAARAAVAVAEDDDALYARAQAVVRHALLREGRRLRAANVLARADDVFWLPLEAVRRGARAGAPLTSAAVTHAIADARAAHAAGLADPPPLPDARPGWDDRATGVRGRAASGGRALGRVHLHVPGDATPVPPGAVLVARTLLPTELPLLAPAALVVETGGPLGHVAAQARERNLPAVVDAAGACAAFRQGDRVLVDGDAGLVIRIGD